MIDTTTIQHRRILRFDSLDAMLADARACAAARSLRQLGNWPLGTALAHIAAWIDYPYLGYPTGLDFPEEVKVRARARFHAIMHDPMEPGERLPGAPDGTYGIPHRSTAMGLTMLEAAAHRLASGNPPIPDPIFGLVTAEQWMLVNLRHAELHLGFYLRE